MIKLLKPGGGSFTASAANSATVKLSPHSNSGESGTATLIKQGEKQTKVALDVTGASGSQPVHIRKGTCAQLGPKPTYPCLRWSTESRRPGARFAGRPPEGLRHQTPRVALPALGSRPLDCLRAKTRAEQET